MASTLATARHPLQLAITRAAGAKAPMRMNIPLGILLLKALQIQGVLLGLVLMNSFDDVWGLCLNVDYVTSLTLLEGFCCMLLTPLRATVALGPASVTGRYCTRCVRLVQTKHIFRCLLLILCALPARLRAPLGWATTRRTTTRSPVKVLLPAVSPTLFSLLLALLASRTVRMGSWATPMVPFLLLPLGTCKDLTLVTRRCKVVQTWIVCHQEVAAGLSTRSEHTSCSVRREGVRVDDGRLLVMLGQLLWLRVLPRQIDHSLFALAESIVAWGCRRNHVIFALAELWLA